MLANAIHYVSDREIHSYHRFVGVAGGCQRRRSVVGLQCERYFQFSSERATYSDRITRYGTFVSLNSHHPTCKVVNVKRCHPFQGFNVTHNATRLIAMTKPVYNSIMRYSSEKPVIVFVPTRKQAKLTAIDILTLTSSDRKPDRFLRAHEEDIRKFVNRINDRVNTF